MTSKPAFLLAAALGLLLQPLRAAPAAIDDARRLYDFGLVSVTNPILAAVPECNIEIPANEFRAFIKFDLPVSAEWKLLTLEEKRRELDKLLDEHFWVWQGYTKNADQIDDIAYLINITRVEAMKAMVIEQDVGPKAHTFDDYERLKKELHQRIFNKAEIHVSPRAYELLKTAAKRINDADRAAATNSAAAAAPRTDGLTPDERALPLATCKIATVRLGNMLEAYQKAALEDRPQLETREQFEQLLQQMTIDELMLAEARERGLDKAGLVRQQVQADRTGLVRQWALSQITSRAEEMMREPATEGLLRKWYDTHLKTRYTIRNAEGKDIVTDFDKGYDEVRSDYFTDLQDRLRKAELRRMRSGRKIEINEKLLEELVVNWPNPRIVPQLEAKVATWDGDTREYVVKPGETNATFSFNFTNVWPSELIIDEVHPVNEFVTVQGAAPPWTIRSGEHREIRLDVDLRNKVGTGYSRIYVESGMGRKTLTLKITYPPRPAPTPQVANEKNPPAN